MKHTFIAIALLGACLVGFEVRADEAAAGAPEATSHCDSKAATPCNYVDADPALPIIRLMPEAKITLAGPIHFRPAQLYSDGLSGKGITCYLAKEDKDFSSQFSNLPRTLPASTSDREMTLSVVGQATAGQENFPRNMVIDGNCEFDVFGRINYSVPVSSNYDKRKYTLVCSSTLVKLLPTKDISGRGKYFADVCPDGTKPLKRDDILSLSSSEASVGFLPDALRVKLVDDPAIPKP